MNPGPAIRPGTLTALTFVAYQAWSIGLGAFVFFFALGKDSAPIPDPATGRTFAFSNHGSEFYVEQWKFYLFYIALGLGMVLFMISVGAIQLRFGKAALVRVRPVSLFLAVCGAVLFWFGAIWLLAD
ncbi:hypothetical protein KB221_07570 [Aquidulcibacter paucihalophilus]|jgi:hypothetical protein|nr:hypothetical protein KB221_07570 [Aquidulcibacter paucihalophilus]